MLAIRAEEGGELEVPAAARLLHDCVAVARDSPLRARASRPAAARAEEVLGALGWPPARVAPVRHAVEAHSSSAGVAPETPEARVLRDADRLDALGAVGVARCFYTCGRLGGALYDAEDPEAARRPPNDARFALDHVAAKLLRLAEGFGTAAGARMARRRHARVPAFLRAFREEAGIGGPPRRGG